MEKNLLPYEIIFASSYSTSYLPENILLDSPSNQACRWSSNTNTPPQYLTLKLKRPAIVKQIKFGKFEKSHVCNLKKFKIFGGLEEDRMILLLESGLKNDAIPEVFDLRSTTDEGDKLPITYLKIMPLLSWGPSFNFSIWYFEINGVDDPMYMSSSLRNYNMMREIEIVKLCLKHFRQQGYLSAFQALQEHTNIRLEHPIISDLHRFLVAEGDFEKAENFVENCVNEGLMDSYMSRQDYKHSWKIEETQSTIRPGTRGGHQLVIDTDKRLIYLYGGWDGFQDLSDLWCFDIRKSIWTLIYDNSESFDGPTPRSCHKMVYDPVSGNIFMLGRYLDNNIRTTEYIKSDFYLYDTISRTWLQICDDTSQVGGPQLVYDHQMCIDVEKRTVYVFGGKILTPRSVNQNPSSEPEYSGLFSYHIGTNTWTQILVDCHHPTASQADILSIKSRITHCMVFHTKNRKLYIYGGQRGKEESDDFISYDVDTQTLNILNPENSRGYQNRNEPPSGFTQRATIDCQRDEIYVFSSISKQKERRDPQNIDNSNSFWVYSLKANKWSRIYTYKYPNDNLYHRTDKIHTFSEPCPRFAHQFIFDEMDKVHYLFGGNPGKLALPQLRLDDFWILSLEKPSRQETLRHCKYIIRKLKYEEVTKTNPIEALQYLQVQISAVIDHSDAKQLTKFHKLASLLFRSEDDNNSQTQSIMSEDNTIHENLNHNELMLPADKSEDICMSPDDTISIQSSDGGVTTSSSSMTSSPATPSPPQSSQSIHDNGSTIPQTQLLASQNADNKSYNMYKKSGGKKTRDDYLFQLKSRRTYLFNRIVQLMPSNMVQPKNNLSDFVLI